MVDIQWHEPTAIVEFREALVRHSKAFQSLPVRPVVVDASTIDLTQAKGLLDSMIATFPAACGNIKKVSDQPDGLKHLLNMHAVCVATDGTDYKGLMSWHPRMETEMLISSLLVPPLATAKDKKLAMGVINIVALRAMDELGYKRMSTTQVLDNPDFKAMFGSLVTDWGLEIVDLGYENKVLARRYIEPLLADAEAFIETL